MMALIFFLFPWGAGNNTTDMSVCIGERCSGQKVSLDYLQTHFFLEAPTGFSIKSFSISFGINNTLYEKRLMGNSFQSILPELNKLKPEQKIYFDNIKVVSDHGDVMDVSAYFTIEKYTTITPSDKIYLARYTNGSYVEVQKITQQDSLWYMDTDYKVTSFTISIENAGGIYDRKCTGNKFPPDVIALIRKIPPHKKIYLDNIYLEHRTDKSKTLKCFAVFKVY